MIDITYGNLTEAEATRMLRAAHTVTRHWHEPTWPAGATEPWITELVGSLLKASGQRTVLETGSFLGHTAAHLAHVLTLMGGGELTACEIETERAHRVTQRLYELELTSVLWTVRRQDVLEVVAEMADQSLGFAFIDDDHTPAHVQAEVEALLPKMVPGGLMVFHDVFGSCDLQQVVTAYGGYCLDLPRAGPAGGLGLLQVR